MPEVVFEFNDEGFIDSAKLRQIELGDMRLAGLILKIKNISNDYNVLLDQNRIRPD